MPILPNKSARHVCWMQATREPSGLGRPGYDDTNWSRKQNSCNDESSKILFPLMFTMCCASSWAPGVHSGNYSIMWTAKWKPMGPYETRWDPVRPSGSKLSQPSRCRQIQMNPNGSKWESIFIDFHRTGFIEWIQMDSSIFIELHWIQVGGGSSIRNYNETGYRYLWNGSVDSYGWGTSIVTDGVRR
jgi:hypothetical protein